MFDCTTLLIENLFWMALSFVFLLISYHLTHKISNLQSELSSKTHIGQLADNAVVDMGFQLFNLIRSNTQSHPGYVYVVKSDSGHYKIGRTADPHTRAKTFGVKLPMEIEFLICIQTGDMNHLENILHRQYEHKRIGGEWFSLSEVDIIFLQNIPGNIISNEKG